uniref:Uncharacterized protein n=1 Tax=Anguilla anguilla TaxID=7936 RepID=A0A0E9X5P2_ANGAN
MTYLALSSLQQTSASYLRARQTTAEETTTDLEHKANTDCGASACPILEFSKTSTDGRTPKHSLGMVEMKLHVVACESVRQRKTGRKERGGYIFGGFGAGV